MGLVGNLEDLGLGDILQIVSLSKKSGVLSLASGQHEGRIIFADGQVVQADSSQVQSRMGDILLRHKLLDKQTLDRAIKEWESGSYRTFDALLVSKYNINSDKIEAIIKAQIERVVYSFFRWDKGTFEFQLDDPTLFIPSLHSSLYLVLARGLNPQWLVAEGRRLIAEGRLFTSDEELGLEAGPPSGNLSEVQTSLPLEAGANRTLFIIDDDEPTRTVLKKAFMRAGFDVEVFALTAELLKACHENRLSGQSPALLIDLIMPRLDGHGILGGLEVMEIVAEKFAKFPMMLMTDHPNAEAEKRARELGGVAVLRKPKKVEIREERGVEALKNMLLEVDRYFEPTGNCQRFSDEVQDIGRDFVDEFDVPVREDGQQLNGSPGLYLLKGMLQELVNPLLSGGVILLILRFASELLNRAVIFDVDGAEIVGIGQFGLDTTTENADRMVRKLRLQVDEESLFAQVFEQKTAIKAMFGDSPFEKKLKEHLGGEDPAEVFIGPLVSEGKVVAVLYADNLPEFKPIGNVETFEIFLSQAGMAMEKVLQERDSQGLF